MRSSHMAATRILYHYNASTFSRRARLALAHKEIDVLLRDPRADATFVGEAERLTPIRTLPVLVDEGRVIADSGAIAMYLDLAYPECVERCRHMDARGNALDYCDARACELIAECRANSYARIPAPRCARDLGEAA
jgi:glutathione S-transferase